MKKITKNSIVKNMTSINAYKKEFDVIIEIYVDLVNQYREISERFYNENYQIEEKTGYSDNTKKSPTVTTLETLRKDILLYAHHLGLTPSGLKKLNNEMQQKGKTSKLDKALNSFGKQ